MLSRKFGIIVSLIMALVFTGLIIHGGRQAYKIATETVDIVVLTQDVPAGAEILAKNVSLKAVSPDIAAGKISCVKEAVGKIAKVGLLEGQFLNPRALRVGYVKEPGNVGVVIDVELASSAVVSAGDLVDIHVVVEHCDQVEWEEDKVIERVSYVLAGGIRVLSVLTAEGAEVPVVPVCDAALDIDLGGVTRTAAVMLEIPEEKATSIVFHAMKGEIHLVRSAH